MLIKWRCKCSQINGIDYEPWLKVDAVYNPIDIDYVVGTCLECNRKQNIEIKVEVKLVKEP